MHSSRKNSKVNCLSVTTRTDSVIMRGLTVSCKTHWPTVHQLCFIPRRHTLRLHFEPTTKRGVSKKSALPVSLALSLYPATADPTKPVCPPGSSDSRPRQAPLCSSPLRCARRLGLSVKICRRTSRCDVPTYYANSVFISGYTEYFTDMRQRWGRGPTPRHLKK